MLFRSVKLGLRKAADYVYPSRIKPGTPAWNKGIPNSTGTSATRFKKGNMPRTTKPLGSVGKTKEGHVLVKVAMPNVWVRKDVLDYEAKHGPLSPRLILRHREFVAVDRAANMRMNSYHRYPKEIARLIQLRGALNRQINKRVRNAQ